MKKTISILLLAVFVCVIAAGCSIEVEEKQKEPEKYSFYYLNTSETNLKKEAYEPKEETRDFMMRELMQNISSRKAPEDGSALLPEKVALNSYDFKDNTLVIDFSQQYHDMSRAREVLMRAGIVKTFLQVPDIEKIRFTVEGQALTDSRNREVGDMTKNSFLDLSGVDADSYRYDTFTLYFADKSGKKLVKEERNIYYSRSLPKARVVLEQLAKGPMEKGHYASLPEASVVLNTSIADRICYINMNQAFRSEDPEVAENVRIYSVVNSILDSCEADKVQISIEGSMEGNLESSMALYTFYQKNEELVVQEETKEEAAEKKAAS